MTYGLGISELKTQGIIDGNIHLTPSYDAVTVNWGGDWRMPTMEEMQELIDNCTCTWTTQNGFKGCKVASKTNSNSIFLPLAGYRDGSSLYNAGCGLFWSSTPDDDYYDYGAYYLYFYGGDENVDWDYGRFDGFTVRSITE